MQLLWAKDLLTLTHRSLSTKRNGQLTWAKKTRLDHLAILSGSAPMWRQWVAWDQNTSKSLLCYQWRLQLQRSQQKVTLQLTNQKVTLQLTSQSSQQRWLKTRIRWRSIFWWWLRRLKVSKIIWLLMIAQVLSWRVSNLTSIWQISGTTPRSSGIHSSNLSSMWHVRPILWRARSNGSTTLTSWSTKRLTNQPAHWASRTTRSWKRSPRWLELIPSAAPRATLTSSGRALLVCRWIVSSSTRRKFSRAKPTKIVNLLDKLRLCCLGSLQVVSLPSFSTLSLNAAKGVLSSSLIRSKRNITISILRAFHRSVRIS